MLWLDTETFNPVGPPKLLGVFNYTKTCELMLLTYAFDDDPVQIWDLFETPEMPGDLREYLFDTEDPITSHHAQFDREAVANTLRPTDLRRWRCSMVQAQSCALPGALADIGAALGLPEDQRKLKDGKQLINLFCTPAPKNHKAYRYTPENRPEQWARFREYAIQDTATMRTIVKMLPTWNWREKDIELYYRDQEANRRGFLIDRELAQAGADASAREKEHILTRFGELADGLKPTQRAKIRELINDRYHLGLTSTAQDVMIPISKNPNHPAELREMAELILRANKTSTAKYGTLIPAISDDGRLRGSIRMNGAGRTRRYSAVLFQPHNLPSRALPAKEIVDLYIRALKAGCHDILFDDQMRLSSAALRGLVIAPDGAKLNVSDLSNIEGRVLAWLADEQWKLRAFVEYDNGTGPDLYKITAAAILGGSPWDVSKLDRNVFGKVPDLANGYQGGVAGCQQFARAYNVRMADHWDTIKAAVKPGLIKQAEINFERWGFMQLPVLDIDRSEWIASEVSKLAWRARHLRTVALWKILGIQAVRAINTPDKQYRVGKHLRLMSVFHEGVKWLLIRLPSGNFLTYMDPVVTGKQAFSYMGLGTEDEGSTARIWTRLYTHGGKLTGNCCQSIAGDLLKERMIAIEDRGYTPLFSVHDEVITETPDTDDYSAEELSRLLATNPPWAEGLPLAADGFETPRYYKD